MESRYSCGFRLLAIVQIQRETAEHAVSVILAIRVSARNTPLRDGVLRRRPLRLRLQLRPDTRTTGSDKKEEKRTNHGDLRFR